MKDGVVKFRLEATKKMKYKTPKKITNGIRNVICNK